jgi:hypothetical protein
MLQLLELSKWETPLLHLLVHLRSRECPSDDLDDTYIDLDDDFIAEAHATRDANAAKELLARRAIRY